MVSKYLADSKVLIHDSELCSVPCFVGTDTSQSNSNNIDSILDAVYNSSDTLDVETSGFIIGLFLVTGNTRPKQSFFLLGKNVQSILQTFHNGHCIWFSDGKDIKAVEQVSNQEYLYLYRELKGNCVAENIDNLQKLINGPINSRRLGAYTKSLYPYVKSNFTRKSRQN